MKGTFGLNTCIDTTSCLSANMDFYIVDREHGRASFTEASSLLNAISKNCQKFVRVSQCDRVEIQRTLELRPDGILVPQISSFDDASKAISYSFFPPLGSRGVSPYTKAFGFHHDNLANKKAELNKSLKLGLLIEGQPGFNALPEILDKLGDDIEFVYFGLFDFASSQGFEPNWQDEKLSLLLTKFVQLAKNAGVAVGTIAKNQKDIETLEALGVEYIVFLNDLGLIHEAVSQLWNRDF